MNKFVWNEGDIRIGRTQCELCAHHCKATPNTCPKYEAKPEEVKNGTVKCPHIQISLNTPW